MSEATDAGEAAFPFFKLPPKIRNMIYKEVVHDRRVERAAKFLRRFELTEDPAYHQQLLESAVSFLPPALLSMKGLIRHEALKVLGKQPFTIDWRTAETLCLWKLHLHRILGWSYLTKLSHIVLRLPEDSSDAPQHEYLKFLNAILVHRPERDLYTGLLCMGNYAELPGLAPKCRCTRAAPVHLCPQCPARRAALRKLSLVVPDESTRMIDVMDPDVRADLICLLSGSSPDVHVRGPFKALVRVFEKYGVNDEGKK